MYEHELPFNKDTKDYDIVLGFDYLLFLFDYIQRDVWCLDLLLSHKWHKSAKKLEKIGGFGMDRYIMEGNNNNIYFMNFEDNILRTASLYHVLPESIINDNIKCDTYLDLLYSYLEINNLIRNTIKSLQIFILKNNINDSNITTFIKLNKIF